MQQAEQQAFANGVTVPGPLWLGDASVLGREFFIMRRAGGTAAGHKLVRDLSLAKDRPALTRQLGRELARIHSIVPPRDDLDFLSVPEQHPALLFIEESRRFLDDYHSAFPALEWGLSWLEDHLPALEPLCLVHRDFRTGNYMVDEQGLTAVLDWEFTAWSQPLEDLGWLCARCWRFGQNGDDHAVGGIGKREDLFSGYAEVSGRLPTASEVYYWEVFAHLRWAMVAIKQGERHLSGKVSKFVLDGLKMQGKWLSPERQLAKTCALEHFTAMLAELILEHPDFLEGMDQRMLPLWLWHAVAESEHKAVAFDVYQDQVGSYWVRSSEMAITTVEFIDFTIFHYFQLRADMDDKRDLRSVAKGLNWLLGKPGWLRRLGPSWLAYFKRDFHPSKRDSSVLRQHGLEKLAALLNRPELLEPAA